MSGRRKKDSDSDAGIAEWSKSQLHFRSVESSGKGKAGILRILHPCSLEYANPLNAIFLSEVPLLGALNASPVWLIRDGLIPLLWFFKRHPHPGKIKSRLLVHEDLAGIVPKAWRPITGTYHVVSNPNLSKNRPKLLITGMLMEQYCSLEALEETVKGGLGKTESTEEILLHLPTRFYGLGNSLTEGFPARFISKVFQIIGTSVRLISWPTLQSLESLTDFDVFEANQNLVCSDSYLLHLTLGRGARLVTPRPTTTQTKRAYIPLSPHHGLMVRKQIPARLNPNPHLKDFNHLLRLDCRLKKDRVIQPEPGEQYPLTSWFPFWKTHHVPSDFTANS